MKTAELHSVIFYSPGTLFSETSVKSIDSWNIKEALEMSKDITERYGAKPYCFRFTTSLVAEDIDDRRGGKMKVKPKEIARSGQYFLPSSYVYTYDQAIHRNDPKETILLSNMRCNNWWAVVVSINGYKSIHPLEPGDVILNSEGQIIDSYENYQSYFDQMNAKEAI